jgi:hypothetical protein
VSLIPAWLFLSLLLGVSGCGRLKPKPKEMVYVAARRAYLRDRVAAVSNRTAEVVNAEPLEVLEHGRRFLRVRTPKNETGWIEQHMVIDQQDYDAFEQLAQQHKDDPEAATATLNDDLYMHIAPGRDTDHFYLLPGNTQVKLLERGSVPKGGQSAPAPLARLAQPMAKPGEKKGKDSGAPKTEAPPAMEDWWLARDAQGHTGWMLSSRLYVNVPDAIAEYGEGQDFVGAWPIATITDPQSDAPNHQVPEYLTVMAPPKSGLPFDFDQVRVFTWSRIHHRYETGFRLHPIQGFLPVKIFTEQTPAGPVPAFSFLLGDNGDVKIDPDTGVARPVHPRTIEYEVIDTQVKRIGADTAPISTRHEDSKASTAGKKSLKKRR